MNNDRRWYFGALGCGIVLAIAIALIAERECQKKLAFQRAYPASLTELIEGPEPVKCWFVN